jgi:hypothetical protein
MFKKRPLSAAFAVALLLAAFVAQLPAAQPAWWTQDATRILPTPPVAPDNYAVANLGQLKHVAAMAKKHLDDKLSTVGRAGQAIDDLVAGLEPRAGSTPSQIIASREANYAPVNLGQLKAVAKPFYDRLRAVGYNTRQNLIDHGAPGWAHDYPWNPATPVAENYSPANLGQMKWVFSFDLSTFSLDQDADGDGIPNGWEVTYGLDPQNPADAEQIAPGGITYVDKFQQGLDPTKADTDDDGVNDVNDGAPRDPDLSPPPVPETRYAVIDLTHHGLLAADYISRLNNKCQLICAGGGGVSPIFWDNGQRTEISMASADGINNNGVVVGNVQTQRTPNDYVGPHAARWSVGVGAPEVLYGYVPPFSGSLTEASCPGVAINDFGHIVGWSQGYAGIEYWDCGTIWVGSGASPLGDVNRDFEPPISNYCDPLAISNSGTIVGVMESGPYDAFVSSGSAGAAIIRLAKLPTPPEPFGGSPPTQYPWAGFINRGGSIIAGSMVSGHPVMWVQKNGAWKCKNLGPWNTTTGANDFAGGNTMRIIGVNDRAEMVGNYYGPSGVPFLWQNGKLVDLNSRVPRTTFLGLVTGWSVLSVADINDQGVIAARVQHSVLGVWDIYAHPALLLPVEMITINTFIPDNYVDDPIPFSSQIYEGDDRTTGTPARAKWDKDGSHRTQQKFNVIPFRNMGDADGLEDNAYANDPDGVKNDAWLNHCGTTNRYHKTSSLAGGKISAAAKADTTLGDNNLKTASGTASTSGMKVEPTWLGDRKIKVKCTVKSGNPLAPSFNGNEIDYVLELTIDYTDAANPRYSLTGEHDGFPAYEVYIGTRRIHHYDPLATGEGLTSLFDPMDKSVSQIDQPIR